MINILCTSVTMATRYRNTYKPSILLMLPVPVYTMTKTSEKFIPHADTKTAEEHPLYGHLALHYKPYYERNA